MKKFLRCKTRDAAFAYRMGAGFPGDVNRAHPASIEPGLTNVTAPPTAYGQPALIDTATNSYRKLGVADASDSTAVNIDGVLVRPFPNQQSSATDYGTVAIGAATPPATGVQDFLRAGYIMGKVPADAAAATKKGTVYVWCAANTGNHVLGGFETAASTGNTVPVANAEFNGPADASGNIEVIVWLGK